MMRSYKDEKDLYLITDLLQAVPSTSPHLVDLPWRLSSPAIETGEDICLWEGSDGALLGFAAWQQWWAALDFFIKPGPHTPQIEEELFAWAAQRFRTLDQERGWPLPYWVEYREDDLERRALVERHGYLLDDDYYYVYMRHPLTEPLPEPQLPPGFAFRSLAGEQEIDAYVALHRAAFESTSMVANWRRRTLRQPQYRPELDLVVVAPSGALAGFCVGWLDEARKTAQVEPTGVHPDFQGHGLGRALLYESLRRFKALGAEQALVEPDSPRVPARHHYEAVGFQPIHQGIRKGQWFSDH